MKEAQSKSMKEDKLGLLGLACRRVRIRVRVWWRVSV